LDPAHTARLFIGSICSAPDFRRVSRVLGSLDLVIVGLFLAATVATGLWFSRRWRGSEDFFLAGRSLRWPLIGFSLFATNISAEHFVGLAAGGAKDGLVQGGWEWMASYCLIVLALVFAPQYLRQRVYTIPEFFERRYGLEARVGLAGYFLAMIVLTKTAVAIYAGTKVIHYFLAEDFPSISPAAIMWTLGAVTALYTMAGGLTAVVYTDTIQAIVLIAGSVILTLRALGEVGGWSGLVDALAQAGESDKLSMVRPATADEKLPFSGYVLGNFLVGGMFYWCMDQVNVQRVLGARSIEEGRRGAVFAGFLKIIPVFIFVLPGVIASVLWRNEISDADATYSFLVDRLLGPGLRGLVLAALMAALMSSLSSAFNSAATIASRDFLARFRPTASARAQILVGQIALVLVMVSGVTVASSGFIAQHFDHLWDYLQEVTGYLSAPFAAAGLLGVLSRRVNRAGALAGIIAGILAGGVFFVEAHADLFLENDGFIEHPLLQAMLHRVFVAFAIACVTMVAVSLVTTPPSEEVRAGAFSIFARKDKSEVGEPKPHLLADSRLWAAILFAIVTTLWVAFR